MLLTFEVRLTFLSVTIFHSNSLHLCYDLSRHAIYILMSRDVMTFYFLFLLLRFL
jgi:hypothetical protein